MPRVLAGPTTTNVTNNKYGKCYNILNNLNDDEFTIDAYARSVESVPTPQNVRVHTLNGANRLSFYMCLYRTLAHELRRGDIDVYHHMNLGYRWFNPLLLAELQGEIPVIIGPCQAGHAIMAEEFNNMLQYLLGIEVSRTVTDPVHAAIDGTRDYILDPPRMELFKRTLESADRIVVVHEEAKEVYAELVDESKIRTIPLGVNVDLFDYSEPEDTQELVAIGSLRERKGYDILLNALDMVCAEFPDTLLHVFGEGPLEEQLRQQVVDRDLQSNVDFHGFVEQSTLRKHLSRARAFVHPSRSESFSLVRLEAMSMGCPVIVSDISGAQEMVRDGQEGFVVPIESPDAIADAVATLFSDYDLTKQIGEQARNRVESKYDWRKIGDAYMDLYRSLTG